MRLHRFALLAGIGLCAVLAGCEPTKEQLVAQGRSALLKKDLDTALTKFEAALALDPNNFNGLWGQAQVLGMKGEYKKEEEVLKKLLSIKEFAERRAPIEELDKVYQKLADQAKSVKEQEAYLRKAIATHKGSDAHKRLADLLIKQGKAATLRGDHAAAKVAYDKIADLRVRKKVKRSAAAKAKLSAYMAFKDKFRPEFDKFKLGLINAGIYDGKTNRFFVEGKATVEGAKPTDEGVEPAAEREATVGARVALEDLAFTLSGVPRPDGAKLTFEASIVKPESKGWQREGRRKHTYTMRFSVPEDAIFQHVHALRTGPPPKSASAAKPAPGTAAAKPDPGAPAANPAGGKPAAAP